MESESNGLKEHLAKTCAEPRGINAPRQHQVRAPTPAQFPAAERQVHSFHEVLSPHSASTRASLWQAYVRRPWVKSAVCVSNFLTSSCKSSRRLTTSARVRHVIVVHWVSIRLWRFGFEVRGKGARPCRAWGKANLHNVSRKCFFCSGILVPTQDPAFKFACFNANCPRV